MDVKDSEFHGNFGKLYTNGLTMMGSTMTMHNTTIDNKHNEHGFKDQLMKGIETGFIKMSYKSNIVIT